MLPRVDAYRRIVSKNLHSSQIEEMLVGAPYPKVGQTVQRLDLDSVDSPTYVSSTSLVYHHHRKFHASS